MSHVPIRRPTTWRGWLRLLNRDAGTTEGTEAAPPPARPARRWSAGVPGIMLAAIGGAWLAASAWLILGQPGERDRQLVADLLPPILDVMAAALVLHAARRAATRRATAAWTAIAIATIVYGFGDTLFAWFELGLHAVPFPSLADLAYVIYYPIVVAALLSFPTARATRAERLRLAIECSIVVIGGGMVVWQFALRSTLESLGADPVASALSIGYPVGDMVLLFGVAAVALRHPAGVNPRALMALVGGLFLVFGADIGNSQVNADGASAWQSWPDVLYMASTLCIAAAGFLQTQARPLAVGARDDETIPRPLLFLPYLGLAAGYGTLVATAVDTSGDKIVLLVAAIVLTAVVLARQELVLRENSALQAQHARRVSEARFRSLAGNASDAIVLVDPAGIVTDATDATRRVLGLDPAALIGRSITSLAHADDAPSLAGLVDDAVAMRPAGAALEWRLWDGNGTWRQVETIAANLIDDPAIGRVVLTTRDVRERKVLQQRLRQVALHDILTGLPNRTLFLDRIEQALVSQRAGEGTVVLALNIDGFKRFNDSLGPPVGDRLLQEVALRLGGALRAADTCARLGGDEFGVLLDASSTALDGRVAATRILAALGQPFTLPLATVRVAVRIGIAVAESTSGGPAAVLRDAVVAMAHAREDRRGGVAVFEPAMQQELDGRFELEADLRLAFERDELVLQYQPILDLVTGELVAAEALVRWDHPTRGRLAPNLFIPLAEETGLIDQLGTWVLRTACGEVAQWARIAHGQVPRLAVNLSPHQVADPNLPWTIQAAISEAGAVPAWISLEVTESILMENTAAILERLNAIRSLGISIAIDDFGTGYSSLAYLQQFPMSYLKIDRTFVTPLDDPEREPGLVRAVVEIAHALGMSTVAEGIETVTELNRLQALGCELGQGFLLGRPLDSDVIRALIANPALPEWAPAGTPRARRRRVRPVAA